MFDVVEVLMIEHLDWVLVMRCKVHEAHKSVEWSLKPFGGQEVVDAAHIGIASLHNVSTPMQKGVEYFMRQHLAFEDRNIPAEEKQAFWMCLDVLEALVALYVLADPLWDSERKLLIVDSSFKLRPQWWNDLKTVILSGRQVRRWSNTRWAGCSRASRIYMRSSFLGIEGAVNMVFNDRNTSSFLLKGYREMGPIVNNFIALAALGTRPAEKLVLELLIVDRLLQRSAQLLAQLDQGYIALTRFPTLVWQRFSAHIGLSQRDFYDRVMLVASIVHGWVVRDLFQPLSMEPLQITQGDIVSNVESLLLLPMLRSSIQLPSGSSLPFQMWAYQLRWRLWSWPRISLVLQP